MKRAILGLGAVCLVSMALPLQAAVITWGAATNVAAVSDVVNANVLVEAFNTGGTTSGSDVTVNGVPFRGKSDFLDNNSDSDFFSGDTGNAAYNALLSALDFGNGAGLVAKSVGGGQLAIGREYLIQVWWVDTGSNRDMQFGDGHSNTVDLASNPGQYVIGTFTADGTSQALTLDAQGGMGNAHFTAYQIRGNALIADDFSASSIHDDNRFFDWDVDRNWWVERDGAAWAISDGVLTNPAAVSPADDRGAHRIDSVSADPDLTLVTFAFDYTVVSGSTLYVSSSLFTGPNAGGLQGRLTHENGIWWAADYNDKFIGPDYNLKDGTTPSGLTSGALASFKGPASGTFNQTYDISGYGGGGFNLAGVSHIMTVFTANTSEPGDGAITIDNLLVTGDAFANRTEFLGTGTWGTPSRWTGGLLPGTNQIDIAVIAAGDTSSVTNPVAPTNAVHTRVRGESGILNILADFSSNGGDLWVGHSGATPGNLNQSAGTVTVNDLQISGVNGSSTYTLIGGTLNPASVSINANGTILVDGGTFSLPGLVDIDNGALLDIRAGSVTNNAATTISGGSGGRIEISGGMLSVGNDVGYQSDFTGADLASAGLVASAGAAGGSWAIDDLNDELDGTGAGNARASVYTSDSWQNDGGFTLDVTFWGSSALVRHSFGIVDAVWNVPGDGDWLNSSLTGAYGIGFSTAGSGPGTDYLGFNNDAGTVTVLSTNQGNITSAAAETMTITVTSNSWSYSLNGAPATTGSFTFDTSRSYRFIAYAQSANRASFSKIALSPPESASTFPATFPAIALNTDLEISGGTFDYNNEMRVGYGGSGSLTVLGRAATIQIKHLNQTSSTGTHRFVLDAAGVSKISVPVGGWAKLDNFNVTVDGANFNPYTSSTEIMLIDGDNSAENTAPNLANLSYTNFHPFATLEFVYESDDLKLRYSPPAMLIIIR
jgi:hypothetical protein